MSDQKAATVEIQRLSGYLLTSILNPNSPQTWPGLTDLIYNARLEDELKSDESLCIRLKNVYEWVNQVQNAVVREKILRSDEEVFAFLQRLDAKVMHPPMIGSHQVSLGVWKTLLGVPRITHLNFAPPRSLSSSQTSVAVSVEVKKPS